uniref:N-myc (And STAT) interactor n=1 Tax=Nothobranchius furzeri TaxID=105023 RepID=A0A1A8B458_NOTFU
MSTAVQEDNYEEALKELKALRAKVEKAEDTKSRLLLEKLEEDEAKGKAQREMMEQLNKQKLCEKEFKQQKDKLQDEIDQLSRKKQDLQEKLRKCRKQLETKRAESTKLKERFKIYAPIPHTEVKFLAPMKERFKIYAPIPHTEVKFLAPMKERFKIYAPIPHTEVKFLAPMKEKECTDEMNHLIRGVFTISQQVTLLLQGGQALLTFEEEKVASQILKMAHCRVTCEDSSLDVKPKRITMETPVTFEVHLDMSRKELQVLDVPPSMPEERIKDRLEMSFSKSSRGGGEVESVDYDEESRKGRVIFLHPGVAVDLAMRGDYIVDLEHEEHLKVEPTYRYDLQKFQTFCGSVKRTILLDVIGGKEDEEDLQDHLEIHFQKPSNSGGEIECIRYISEGKTLQAFFSEDKMDVE